MFPSEWVLERRVRTADDEDFAATDLPLFILRCEDRKADGYAGDDRELYTQLLNDMVIGVRLADTPPAVSYLAILGRVPSAEIVAVDKTVIVISLDFTDKRGQICYLIYDAVALSLTMIPKPKDPSWLYTLSSRVSIARSCRGSDYALVHTGRLVAGGEDSVILWRPSSSSPPWSEGKTAGPLDLNRWSQTNSQFYFNGHAYWVNLLSGVAYCSCDALFDDDISSVVKFGRLIGLPVKRRDYSHNRLIAYRTIGVVGDSFIRFVSIDGFQDYVKLKKRTVTVWKLLGHDERWKEEYKFSLETLWGFEGFGELPKDLTPMYPLLSTKDMDVVYLMLGEYTDSPVQRRFSPKDPRYLLAIDMRNKIVQTTVPLQEDWDLDQLFSCDFSQHLHKALAGPYDDV